MLKRNFIKICATLLLVVSLVFSVFVSANATTVTPELNIGFCNLSFSDSVYIKYAVSSNVENVKLLVWTASQTEYKYGSQQYILESAGEEIINSNSYYIFDFKELAAKQMTDDVYAVAYANSGGTDYYSKLNKYSIIQYAYNKLGKTGGSATTNEKLKNLLTDMLQYGASAQKYFDYKIDRLATDDFYQVKLSEGTLTDGSNHGLYLTGDKVTIKAPATNSSNDSFSGWSDSAGNTVAATDTYDYTVGTENVELKPEYATYSKGLEFDTNNDGTCALIGIGDCTDTDIIIPRISPDGEIVVSIEASAFSGEPITSITIPNSIESIGRRAFNGCTSLTDVYFDGTEAEWNEISIAANNTPLTDATIHFLKETAKSYTVTFKDYDGTVLKTETVESGASATPPANPYRIGYIFSGWDNAFVNVTDNLTVTAQYREIVEPAIVTGDATASQGESIQVPVIVKNNPGFMNMLLTLNYDDTALTLTNVAKGEAVPASITFTQPGKLVNGCKFGWDGQEISENDVMDGTILILTFKVSDNAAKGTYNIDFTYVDGDITDSNLVSLDMEIYNGKITVK